MFYYIEMILLIICILILFLILVAVHTIDSRVLCFIFLGVVLILRLSYGFMLRYIYNVDVAMI